MSVAAGGYKVVTMASVLFITMHMIIGEKQSARWSDGTWFYEN